MLMAICIHPRNLIRKLTLWATHTSSLFGIAKIIDNAKLICQEFHQSVGADVSGSASN